MKTLLTLIKYAEQTACTYTLEQSHSTIKLRIHNHLANVDDLAEALQDIAYQRLEPELHTGKHTWGFYPATPCTRASISKLLFDTYIVFNNPGDLDLHALQRQAKVELLIDAAYKLQCNLKPNTSISLSRYSQVHASVSIHTWQGTDIISSLYLDAIDLHAAQRISYLAKHGYNPMAGV